MLCFFGFVQAKKFRDSTKYSDCVQNVWVKSCLPCQRHTYSKKKKLQSAERRLGTSLALECHAQLVGGSYLCSNVA